MFLSLWAFVPGAIASPCSPDNRTSDLPQCLSTMIEYSMNNTRFWYGTSYPARCPNPWGSVDCFNPHPYRADSLVSRVFGPGYVLQSSLITTFLSVTFETGTGSYSGCGNVWTVTENRRIDLDPTVTNIYRPWSVRNRPTMTWSANHSELYTLIVFDTGYLINHGIFLNIPGNNISQSEIFKDFHGPRPTRGTPNVYAFLLFKQSGRIQLSEEWRQKLGNSMTSSGPNAYNMTDAINYLNLTGPVAMNWMSIAIDAYAVQLMINDRILFACPNLVSEALKNHNRTFIPKGASMTVFVDVTFSPSAVTFTSCCTTYSKPQRSFQLNPLGDASVGSWDVRSDANPVPELSVLGFYMQRKNFTGKTFTLLCVDPDVPRATAGTQERPLLHWMVVNIPEGRVAEGDTVMTYRGPQPPDTAHYYYFLLYEQNNLINTTEAVNYTSPPNSRYLFDISSFTSDNSLSLVGASWFVAKPDEFTRQLYTASGGNVTSLCAGQPNFATPCPVSGSAHWGPTLYQMLLTLCCFVSFKMIVTSG